MSGPMRGARVRVACLSLLVLLAVAHSAPAQDDYYRGRTIRIVVGYSAGGGFDTYARAIARHLAKHVPGKPSVIVENMPGAAGLVAANSIYRAGRTDRLTIVNFQSNQVMGQILGREGVEFDARKFEWIGAPTRENAVCALTRSSGITSGQQWAASKTPVKLGSVAPGGATHDVPRVLQAALGLPIHLVRGYKGTAEIRLAETAVAAGARRRRGDRGASGDGQAATRPAGRADGAGPRADRRSQAADPHGDHRPDHGLASLRDASGDTRRPGANPPRSIPKTLSDPEFVSDARQAQLDIDPVSGEDVTRLVGELFKMPPTVLAKLKELLR